MDNEQNMNIQRAINITLILLLAVSTAFAQKVPFKMRPDAKTRVKAKKVTEQHNPEITGEVRKGWVVLPGRTEAQEVEYEVIDGLAIFEGDIILGDASVVGQNLRSAAASGTLRLWPNGTIPYTFSSALTPGKLVDIQAAINMVNAQTNLNLVPRTEEEDFVFFVPSSGCSSFVGRQGGQQVINVAGWCERGSIIHEIMHAAGMFHEQSRNDRDKHIEVIEDNIQIGRDHNFDKMEGSGFNLGPYDFASLMHYSLTAFGIPDADGNSMKTIRVKNPAILNKFDVGQRDELSYHDRKNINLYYPLDIPYEPGDRRIVTTIKRIEAQSEDECGSKMDFYGSTEAGPATFWNPGNGVHKTDFQVRVGEDDLKVRWTSLVYIPRENTAGQVIIEISDMDTQPPNLAVRPGNPDINPDCGGNDDKVDINPDRGRSYLPLHIDFSTGVVSLIRKNNSLMPLGNTGEKISTSGILANQNIEKGKITFRIDVH